MVAIDVIEAEEFEFRIETRSTTKNMQIETGVRILMISSPNESRRVLGHLSSQIWDQVSILVEFSFLFLGGVFQVIWILTRFTKF